MDLVHNDDDDQDDGDKNDLGEYYQEILMCETVFDAENDDVDTVREDENDVGDPGNANTEIKDGNTYDANYDNADAGDMKDGDSDDADMDEANYDNAGDSDAQTTKANDYGIDNVNAADTDKDDDVSNDSADADADNDDASPNSKCGVIYDIDTNDDGTDRNNHIDDPDNADAHHDLALLYGVVQYCIAPVILVQYVNLKPPEKGRFYHK